MSEIAGRFVHKQRLGPPAGAPTSRRAVRVRGRKTRSEMGRSALRLRRAEGRRPRDRGRDHRVLPQPHVRLQDAEGGRVRINPEDVDRENPEIHPAQSGGFGEGVFGLKAECCR